MGSLAGKTGKPLSLDDIEGKKDNQIFVITIQERNHCELHIKYQEWFRKYDEELKEIERKKIEEKELEQ